MSDLAPFVAASLRDKVVSEMHEEVLQLRQQLFNQRQASQSITITGPMGSPIYTQAQFIKNGKFDVSPELWKVEFPNPPAAVAAADDDDNDDDKQNTGDDSPHQDQTITTESKTCTLSKLSELEVRIGGILKAKLIGDSIEGFVNDIDNNYAASKGALSIWFGGSSGIWLTIRLVGIEKQAYATLRDFDLSGDNLLATLLQFCSPQAPIEFSEVSFLISHINDAMVSWGLPTEPPEVLPPTS